MFRLPGNQIVNRRFLYDGFGRLVQFHLVEPMLAASGTTKDVQIDRIYDALGRLQSESVPYPANTYAGWPNSPYKQPDTNQLKTTYTYDVLDRPKTTTAPDTGVTSWSYDRWKTTTTNPRNVQKETTTDGFGRLKTVVEYPTPSAPATTQYSYNVLNHLTSVVDAAGKTTTITSDALGRKTAMTDPNTGTWAYDYFDGGQLKKQTDAKGQVVEFTYDNWNRPATRVVRKTAGAPADYTVTYTYDTYNATDRHGRGKLTTVALSQPSITTNYYYDKNGDRTRESQTAAGETLTTRWTYDRNGELTSMVYPGGETVHYSYNKQGSIASLVGTSTYASSLTYNHLGLPVQVTYGNNVTTRFGYWGLTGTEDTRTVNPSWPAQQSWGRLWRIRTVAPNGSTELARLEHGYDLNGNVDAWKDWSPGNHGGLQTLTYDGLDRLTDVTPAEANANNYTAAYTYNAVGNLTQKLEQAQVRYRYLYDANRHQLWTHMLPNRITIRARATSTTSTWPTMQLWVNGSQVQQWTVSNTAYASFTAAVTLTGAPGGDKIEVVYTNHATSRQLFVDYVVAGERRIQAEGGEMVFDASGTLSAGTELFPANGRLRTWLRNSGSTAAYDANGNQTQRTGPTWTALEQVYDTENRLARVVSSDATGAAIETRNGYDGEGRLITRTVRSPVLFGDSFDRKDTAAWTYNSYQTVPFKERDDNYVVESRSSGSDFSGTFSRTATVSNGRSVQLDFNVSMSNTWAIFALVSAGSPHRVDVVAAENTLFVQYTTDGVNWYAGPALVDPLPVNAWYTLRLVVDDAFGGVRVEAWPQGNPAAKVSHFQLLTAGQSWRFQHWIWQGTAWVDSYIERQETAWTGLTDEFATLNTGQWVFSGHQTANLSHGDGYQVLRNTGTGSNANASFYRSSYSLTSGGSAQIDFKVSAGNSAARLAVENNDATYRRFGVLATSGTLVVEYNDGAGPVYPADGTLVNPLPIDAWYTIKLVVDDATGFRVEVWPRGNPAAKVTYNRTMATGKSWRFRHWLDQDSAYLDNYVERAEGIWALPAAQTTRSAGGHYEKVGTTETKRYVLPRAGRQQLVASRTGSTVSYLHPDHLGGTSRISNGSGALIAEIATYPYGGTRRAKLTAAMPTDRLYAGYRLDSGIGLYQAGARWYDPAAGRWTQGDALCRNGWRPICYEPVQINSYAYAWNNPVRYTDPTGKCPICKIALAGAGFFTAVDVVSTVYTAYMDTSATSQERQQAQILLGQYVTLALSDGPQLGYGDLGAVGMGTIRGWNRVLTHLRHTDTSAFSQLMRLGARDGGQIRHILGNAGAETVIRAMVDRGGNQILLTAGNTRGGLRHLIGRHLTGELSPDPRTTYFNQTLQVGDVIDLVAQTIQNGNRTLGSNNTWEYTWTHPTWGEIMVIVDQAGEVISAYPIR